MTTITSTINSRDPAAELEAAKTRTGRSVDEILADLVAVDVRIFDLNHAIEAITAQVEADVEETNAAVAKLNTNTRVAQIGGTAVRRVEHTSEHKAAADCLHAAFMHRNAELVKAVKRDVDTCNQVADLREALYGEMNRAGMSTEDAKALIRKCTYTRVPKAAA